MIFCEQSLIFRRVEGREGEKGGFVEGLVVLNS